MNMTQLQCTNQEKHTAFSVFPWTLVTYWQLLDLWEQVTDVKI